MMAAGEANRDLIYFTFNDRQTEENLKALMQIIDENKLNVGQVYNLVNDYAEEIRDMKSIGKFGIRQYLETVLSKKF